MKSLRASFLALIVGAAAGCANGAPEPASATRVSSGSVAIAGSTTVVERFAELTERDSFDLKRIASALERIDVGMVFHLRSPIAAAHRWAPAPAEKGEVDDRVVDVSGGCFGSSALARFGATVLVRGRVGKTVLDVARCAGDLSARTPGVVWSVGADDVATFVTFDGGRYRVPMVWLERGLPPGPWRALGAPPRDATLREVDLRRLSAAGSIPETWALEVEASNVAWTRCSAPFWTAALREYDENDARVLVASVKERRSLEITSKYAARVDLACAEERAAFERSLASVLERREAERDALYARMRARFEQP
ncbi:MAG: hypothetical protein U0235_02475 [Polyangiaceae bacterium]